MDLKFCTVCTENQISQIFRPHTAVKSNLPNRKKLKDLMINPKENVFA